MLKAVGCQATMPTRLLCPSSVTKASVMGAVKPPSGICHTYRRTRTKLFNKGAENILTERKTHTSRQPMDDMRAQKVRSFLSRTFTLQSSEALAMMLSSWGHHWMSNTGAACPHTVGADWSILPLCIRDTELLGLVGLVKMNMHCHLMS